ncbi:MAG: citrate lyase holo-[acyl-carrier protein] synthase [Mediterraneibacter faecis]
MCFLRDTFSRPSYRKCIICGCQAQECARTRKHTVEEMQAKIEEMMDKKEILKC